MRKPELTKEKIIKESSILFNTKGYKTTSLSDITSATGFTKGAIYSHFKNKDILEMEAFDSMINFVFNELRKKIKAQNNAKLKLFVFLNHFENYISNDNGGCPLLNLAIEIDDTNFAIKKKAQNALSIFKESIVAIIKNGKKYNQIKTNVNEELVASVVIASLEGGIMMSKLTHSNNDIQNVVHHLKSWIENEIIA